MNWRAEHRGLAAVACLWAAAGCGGGQGRHADAHADEPALDGGGGVGGSPVARDARPEPAAPDGPEKRDALTADAVMGGASGADARVPDASGDAALSPGGKPIALHPDNPHYFIYRDKPTVLITSGEHYGSVINPDFDYVKYLAELQARGLNQTRAIAGTYVEYPGWFSIANNTLAPAPTRYLAPWARAAGGKFDLKTFEPTYFARLKAFVTEAQRRGVMVEVVLFCPFYEDALWNVNPMKASNNINGVGNIARTSALTLDNGALLDVQTAFVQRIVVELEGFDNVYYEVCNEPYFAGVTRAWQDRIIATIVAAEAGLPFKHMIAQGISNGTARITNPNPAVSIFNFHYATPPAAVADNYALGKAIADDETGTMGIADDTYRREGWDFVLAGGGVYSNLDYSFTPALPDGTYQVPASQPGGGGPTLRGQLKILKAFIESLPFVRMKPGNEIVMGGVPMGVTVRVLAEAGKAYGLYVRGGTRVDLVLALPAGKYQADWTDTRTGVIAGSSTVMATGATVTLSSPAYAQDIALAIRAAP